MKLPLTKPKADANAVLVSEMWKADPMSGANGDQVRRGAGLRGDSRPGC